MKRKLKCIFLWLFLLPTTLLGFTFSANPTDEFCAGNGTITFTTFNTDPNGTIIYIIYKLPDTTTPYATVNSNFINGLSAGTYNIVAQETVGSVSTTQQLQVVINNAIVPLEYTVVSLNQACSSTSNIFADVTSGVGVTYEIIDGPQLFPPQSSNTFTGLQVGVYRIRVFDNCGIGIVQTFTVNLNPTGITINLPILSSTTPPSCDFVVVNNTITPATGTVLGYPLNIVYEVHPPGGGTPITFNSNLTNGNLTSQDLVMTIPDYINQTFDYTITITDDCGSVYSQNFVISNPIQLSSNIIILECNQNYFSLIAGNYSPPYTLNFTSVPVGFDPTAFNVSYPGPYNVADVQFGSDTNITPIGMYTVEITDSCGRVSTRTFSIIINPPEPVVVTNNNGCLSTTGGFSISILNYDIVSAIITAAPSNYPNTLPHNVSALVDTNGNLSINPVPLGDYIIDLVDDCGDILPPLAFTVPVYTDQGSTVVFRPGCNLQITSLELSSNNGNLTSVIMTSAPAAFSLPLPFNVTSNIVANGKLYLDNLPGGIYTFDIVDACGYSNSITVDAPGYQITDNNSTLQINCGSFNIPLNFVSNATMNQSFWLQKLLDSSTNSWGHPGTNVSYPEGTVPNVTNSFMLINNATNFNLSFNGTFRIVRHFLSYNNGAAFNSAVVTTIDKDCIEILNPSLAFDQALEIVSTNRLFCSSSGTLDVIITAAGEAPLTYSIITKDGVPFFIDNGTSNIFYDLPTGVYTFQVEDICGNIVTKIYDVAALLSLVNITQPNSLLICKDVILGNETFNLALQTPIVLGSLAASDYTVSYFNSISDAQMNTNAIVNLTNFDPTSNPETIFVRMIFNSLPDCYDVRSFDLIVGQNPRLAMQTNILGCNLDPIVIEASASNLLTTTYLWSTGETTPSITITQIGVTNLSVTATNEYEPGLFCINTKDITVTISGPPEIQGFETIDWTDNNNSITVITSNSGQFEYSLDNISFQDSNVFTNLMPGVYNVYVQDKNGCGQDQETVWILYYVKFFTPNGDGINETWRIKNAQFEQNLNVIIYDRYGKLIMSFDSESVGWDGFYNGQQAISDDYWFVVNREDGRTHRGHFTLKR